MAKKGLGKGLGALLGTQDDDRKSRSPAAEAENKTSGEGVISIRLSLIEPNRRQPRQNFDEEKIDALADSIRVHGVIQPVIISRGENGMYRIIAGERRWRAAKRAGLTEIPALIRELSGVEAAEVALIENLQREDLNPIEEAAGYKALADEYGMTQEEISRAVGKSRSAVANSMRLLSLGKEISDMLVSGEITSGHARALLAIEDEETRLELAKKIAAQGLSVRDAENAIKALSKKRPPKPKPPVNEEYEIQLKSITGRLSEAFGTKVSISRGTKKSKIEIEYYSDEDLERILELVT